MTLKEIAVIKNDFSAKFGLPRQSGRIPQLKSMIVFNEQYRVDEALRGIEEYSHLWLVWGFSDNRDNQKDWYPTVRPPRLGGNKRVGVFATRSPYRPNPIGLTLVTLEQVKKTNEGTVLIVGGADLMDGTPIYDIKPYLPQYESVADARGGFSVEAINHSLEVECAEELLEVLPEESRATLIQALQNDPRPAYQKDPTRRYNLTYAGLTVSFVVDGNVLTVLSIG